MSASPTNTHSKFAAKGPKRLESMETRAAGDGRADAWLTLVCFGIAVLLLGYFLK